MNAERALLKGLAATFAAEGATLIVEETASRPWASATFSGTRHKLKVRLPGCVAPPTDLAERDIDLEGHVLIDIAVAETTAEGGVPRLSLEALTVVAD